MSAAAQQASGRAKHALDTLQAFLLTYEGHPATVEWIQQLKEKVLKDSDTADQAAQSCHQLASAIVKSQKSSTSTVPCKWFLTGQCRKGLACTFSHDLSALQPRPLTKKTTMMCQFFMRGQCIRGPSCPHAHGEEELAKIKVLVARMKKRKMYKLHEEEEPWIEDEWFEPKAPAPGGGKGKGKKGKALADGSPPMPPPPPSWRPDGT
eukprot:TRINITY_DN2186_c0_g1_i5.p1 TRINITY_DN2186_c0_g1~~TRINITY_DN2186_c0_g1_i5.p1  ORF type:complete len:207 (-),score=48.63 TRINITY_DN2186_c0_g1_i5:295-915(-)